MYKVNISILEGLKKQLNANNKVLAKTPSTPAIAKLIKENNKQITIINEAAPILAND